MTFPPSLVRVRVRNSERYVGLWLPVVFIWPFVVLLGLLLSPLVLATSIVLWPGGRGRVLLLAGPRLFQLYCALRGLRVRFEGPSSRVLVYIW